MEFNEGQGMKAFFKKFKARYNYSVESMKNRYPCKVIAIKYADDLSRPCEITYQYVTRLNIRKASLKDLLADRLLVEKFHPSDCVKFGFISAGEILFRECAGEMDLKKRYQSIIGKMLDQ